MASPLVGIRAGPCPHCGSAEVYLRTDGAPHCHACRWTGPPEYDSKYLQSWSVTHLPPSPYLPAAPRPEREPGSLAGGSLLALSGVAFVGAVFVVLYLASGALSFLAWNVLGWTSVLGISVTTLGILVLAAFAILAFGGATVVLGGTTGGASVCLVLGAVAALFSLLLFGGIVGAIGGILFAAAGGALRAPSRSPPRGLPA